MKLFLQPFFLIVKRFLNDVGFCDTSRRISDWGVSPVLNALNMGIAIINILCEIP